MHLRMVSLRIAATLVLLSACGTAAPPASAPVAEECPITPPTTKVAAAVTPASTPLAGVMLFLFDATDPANPSEARPVPAAVLDAVPCARERTCVLSHAPTFIAREHEDARLDVGRNDETRLRIEVTASKVADGVELHLEAAELGTGEVKLQGIVQPNTLLHVGSMGSFRGEQAPEVFAVVTLGDTTEAILSAFAPWRG